MYSLNNFNPAFIRAYVDSPYIGDVAINDDVAMYCAGGEL